MAREKLHTLTEQMFYVLLCFCEECCGTDVMKKTSKITNDRVKIGSGTLYNLIEQFTGEGIIQETKAEGRKRNYVLTEKGREILENEYRRLQQQIEDYNQLGKGVLNYGIGNKISGAAYLHN